MIALDKIEKHVTLHAPVSQVWKAITKAEEFGRWFGVNLRGEFAVGRPIAGSFNEKLDEASIMEYQRKIGLSPSEIRQPEDGFTFCTVEQIEPEHYFSFRWIPYGIDAEIDPKTEATTLVEFFLEGTNDGTLLKIVESGFESIPQNRRERAFRMNEGGWAGQAENIRKYVEKI